MIDFNKRLLDAAERYRVGDAPHIRHADAWLADGNDFLLIREMEWCLLACKDAYKKEEIEKLCELALMWLVYRDDTTPVGKGVLYENVRIISDIHERKNHDYGNSFDKTLDAFGHVAALTRMYDKVNRLMSLVRCDVKRVEDESILDTFRDLAGYAVMTMAYYENIQE